MSMFMCENIFSSTEKCFSGVFVLLNFGGYDILLPIYCLLLHPVPNLSQTSLTVALTPGCERLWTTSNTESEIRRYNRKWTVYWNVIHTLWSLLVQSYTCIGNLWASEGCLVGVYFNTSSLGYLWNRNGCSGKRQTVGDDVVFYQRYVLWS